MALTVTRTLSQADFDLFAQVSGDDNPIHVDPDFSARTRFGRTVSHGMLLYTVLWGMLQRAHPGARQAEQTLMFPAPAYADEPLTFTLEPQDSPPGRQRYAARITRAADGTLCCEGTTEIILPQGEA